MSNSKMLIDASHPEETRVVVLKGNRIEEFDFEAANKKQLRGNIYLAKVTRVEPSLQAAFVEYGGNRHGFLAFSEIHPDYYQIPFADRQALLEEEARAHRDEDDDSRDGRNGGGESRSEGRGERGGGDHRGGEGRGERGGGEGRGERGGGEGRNARGDRGGRAERTDRGDRNQRRSRRHRRDGAAPLDRRGPADESVSEPALETIESDDAVALLGVETEGASTVDGGIMADAPAEVDTEASGDQRPSSERQGQDSPSTDHAASDDHDHHAVTAAAAEAEHVIEHGAEPSPVEAAEPTEAKITEHPALEAVAAPHGPAIASEDQPVPDVDTVGEQDDSVAEIMATAPVEDAAPAFDQDDGDAPVEARDTTNDPHDDDHHAAEDEHVEQIGGDALSDVAPRPVRLRRHYKIQEVIKRRQILLIQVVKEERGNKGAALTTYLSLAGRYSVLMPNTAKGGGISRKITDGEDRKRLKAIAQELDVPEGMGVILRTAGAARSPIEVRRDFEYLLRMWESVRELTLKSSAPTLVYEEGSLIKRSIRDLYSKEVEEIVVAGDAGFGEARDFMRMLMPGNVKSVQHYRDPQPIFAKSGVEAQLDAMFSPHVTLKSGGYIVINQTEALVAIDVNSGRSTREHNIEDTALRTNMEAADEVARQLRLRDLAGLIVVDFIDMEEGRNNRAVERRIKDALKNDRARIQIGRISHFGLLEMSRQRIRTGVLEGSTVACPHCAGAGTVRSTASIALHVLRLLEDALIKDASYDLIVRSRDEVAIYILNQKRAKLVELEQRFGITLTVTADPTLTGMIYHAIERGELATPAIAPAPRQDLVRVDSIAPIFEPGAEFEEDETAEIAEDTESDGGVADPEGSDDASAEGGEARRRKRRRRRRGRERDGASEIPADAPQPSDEGLTAMTETIGDLTPAPQEEADGPSDREPEDVSSEDIQANVAKPVTAEDPTEVVEASAEQPAPEAEETAPRRRRSRRTVVQGEKDVVEAAPAAEDAPTRPRRRRPSRARSAEVEATPSVETMPDEPADRALPPTDDVPVGSRPSADRDVGADTVEHHPPVSDVEAPAGVMAPSNPAETAEADRAASAEPDAAPIAPDPDRPKRSGWWQRAKASFGT